jgi:hypothetical protein
MSPRKDHVMPAVRVSPRVIAQAVAVVCKVLDFTDYDVDFVVSAHLTHASPGPEQAYAWMMAAILIADVAEVDSMTLRELQNSIYKGSQNALF